MTVRDGYYEYNIKFSSCCAHRKMYAISIWKRMDVFFQLKDLAKIDVASIGNGNVNGQRKMAITIGIIKQSRMRL